MTLHKVKPLARYPIGWHSAARIARERAASGDEVWALVDRGLTRKEADTLILKLRVFRKALVAEDKEFALRMAEGWELRFRKCHNRWQDSWEVETAMQLRERVDADFAKVLRDNY
jgi:hypothetical protein